MDDGNTVTDFLQEERDRGITIQSAAISFLWKDHVINLIDTPGHVDFSVEVERCLRVLDGGIAVLDGVAGVEAQTETVWEQANRYYLPRILFVNKMDRLGANFDQSIEMIKERLRADCLQLQIPQIENDEFVGIIDVVSQKYIRFHNDSEGSFSEELLPAFLVSKAQEAHTHLVEQLAELDNTFSDFYLESDPRMHDKEEIQRAIRRVLLQSIQNHDFSQIPVLCGSSLKNKGITQLLDAVVSYLPSPEEIRLPNLFFQLNHQLISLPYLTCYNGNSSIPSSLTSYLKHSPTLLYIFKLHYTTQGMIAFARIYRGTLRPKSVLLNTRTMKPEKVLRILQISADHTETLNESREGQIVAIQGINSLQTGDTLITPKNAFPFRFEPIHIQSPVFTVNVETENQSELAKLEKVLGALMQEDPSIEMKNDEESGQLLLSGMGELHLDVLRQRLKREFGMNVYFSKMRVNYRESIGESCQLSRTMDRTIGNKRYEVKIGVKVEQSLKEGNEIVIEKGRFSSTDAPMSEEFMKSIEEGISSCLSRGPLLGYPMTFTRICIDPQQCLWNAQTPSIIIQSAVISCLSACLRNHQVFLKEPIMRYEATIRSESLGNVISDLTAKRRGEIKEIQNVGTGKYSKTSIHTFVPLAEMIGYSSVIRILTGGESSFSLSFDRYEVVPEDVVDIIKRKG